MKTKPTLYIIDKYKKVADELKVETISFSIYETNKQSLLPYINKDYDIWLGRHNNRGKLIRLIPLWIGEDPDLIRTLRELNVWIDSELKKRRKYNIRICKCGRIHAIPNEKIEKRNPQK